jgi:nucleoid-associated protein YgaU
MYSMPRKKGSTTKESAPTSVKQLDSFAAVAQEVKLQESYKSLLLGIAVVLLVTVMTVGFLKNRNEQITQTSQQEVTAEKVEPVQNVLGVHTVAVGDDLKSISTKYYQSPELFMVIAKENGLSNPDLIEEGTKLSIPKVDKQQLLAPLLSRPSKQDKITGTSYTVEEGDLLWDVAVRAYGDGYKWEQIVRENNLPTPEAIFPGMILQLSR